MKYSELKKAMREFNDKHGIHRKVDSKLTTDGRLIEMIGRVVLKNSSLAHDFPLEERTYEFSNYNKALVSSDLGYSIFATCVKDNDLMRIENLRDEDFEEALIISVVEE